MAGNVHRQRDVYSNHAGYLLQVVIDVVADVAVCASLVDTFSLDDGLVVVR